MSLRQMSIITVTLALLVVIIPPDLHSSPVPARSDDEPNDSIEYAVEMPYSINPIDGGLDSSDIADYYRILDLVGDNDNDQRNCQEFTLTMKRSAGEGKVKATLMESNQKILATMFSEGEYADMEMIVPYDGDYILRFTTDPQGQTLNYTFIMGGQLEVDNSESYDNDNIPGYGPTYTDSLEIAQSLNPIRDVVDYFNLEMGPGWAGEFFLDSDFDLEVQLMDDDNRTLLDITPGEIDRIFNEGDVPMDLLIRCAYPQISTENYRDRDVPYYLTAFVWSFETVPEVNDEDSWDQGISMLEDSDTRVLNLTKHFIEPNGDPLTFNITEYPDNVEIKLVNHSILGGTVEWTEAWITPPENFHGEEYATFLCEDRDGEVMDTLSIKVISVNDLPSINKIGIALVEGDHFEMAGTEDLITVYTIEYEDSDDPLNSLRFTSNETLDFFDVNPDNGTLTIFPTQEDVGTYHLNLSLVDPHGGRDIINITMVVEPVNDPPPEPLIEVLEGNHTSLLPGEVLELKASSDPDPDGDVLTYSWDFGDGNKAQGELVSHSYGGDDAGNRTIRLTVSDGTLSNTTTLRIYVQKPEDIALDNIYRSISDPHSDCVQFEEFERDGEEPIFSVQRESEDGADILSVYTERRGNYLAVNIKVKGSVELDGSVEYHIYIVDPGFEESEVDYRNLTSWDQIPDRKPEKDDWYLHGMFLGTNNENSTGMVEADQSDVVVFLIHINELNRSGLPLPLDRDDFSIYALSVSKTYEGVIGNSRERRTLSDTAGEGAFTIGDIEKERPGGSGSSTLGDTVKENLFFVLIGLLILALLFAVASVILIRKLRKDNRKKEKEFLDEVERMRDEGEDLFGKKEEVKTHKISYEDLYGTPAPKGYSDEESTVESQLPGPGLGNVQTVESGITELKLSEE